MEIKYEIKTMKEFLSLPLICKISLSVTCLGVIIGIVDGIYDGFTGHNIFHIKYLFGYSLGASWIGFFTTIIFDKKRSKRTSIGVLRRHR